MGLVINIWFSDRWERTYFVQELDEKIAKEKAFKMFKQTMSCNIPVNTVKEAEGLRNSSDGSRCFIIEVVATVDQIII